MTPSSQGTTEKKKKSQAFHPSKINFNECYYSVLGVNTTADLVTLTKAYDRIVCKYAIPLMAKTEGNMTASDDKFHELMIILNQAYLVLRNPETRQKYDEQRKKGLIGIHSGIRVFKEEPRACPEPPAPLKKNLTVLPPTSLFPADTSKRAFSDAKNDTTTASIYEVFDPWEYDDDHTPWDSRDEDLANLSDVVKDHRKLCVRMGELMDHAHSFDEMEELCQRFYEMRKVKLLQKEETSDPVKQQLLKDVIIRIEKNIDKLEYEMEQQARSRSSETKYLQWLGSHEKHKPFHPYFVYTAAQMKPINPRNPKTPAWIVTDAVPLD